MQSFLRLAILAFCFTLSVTPSFAISDDEGGLVTTSASSVDTTTTNAPATQAPPTDEPVNPSTPSTTSSSVRAGFSDITTTDLNIRADAKNGKTYDNNYIDGFRGGFGSYFFGGDLTGEKGAKYLMLTIARDAKNIIVLVAIVYLFIMVLRLIFSGGSEEDAKKWKM